MNRESWPEIFGDMDTLRGKGKGAPDGGRGCPQYLVTTGKGEWW